MYKRLLLLSGIVLLVILLWSLSGKSTDPAYEEAREMLTLRRVGHELLLTAGDSKSRVLPVQQISRNEFRIEFEKSFAFEPDSLVKVVERIFGRERIPASYVVNVSDVASREIVYSFATSDTGRNIPCLGRSIPQGRYALNILLPTFTGGRSFAGSPWVIKGVAVALAICLIGFGVRYARRKAPLSQPDLRSLEAETAQQTFLSIGKFHFYPGRQKLEWDQYSISLTSKESKLLQIFLRTPNEVIDRNQLLKEGWEDEGVITGRSLDMYVSKLRKKLQEDPAISIINVHGKGYRLNC